MAFTSTVFRRLYVFLQAIRDVYYTPDNRLNQRALLSTENEGRCVLHRGADTILKYRLQDVLFASLSPKQGASQVVIVARTENFGRAGAVLQMLTPDDAEKLISKLKPTEARVLSKELVTKK